MIKNNPLHFFSQVKREVARISWPTRKEVLVTSALVFIMVFIAAIFFIVIDKLISLGVNFLLGI